MDDKCISRHEPSARTAVSKPSGPLRKVCLILGEGEDAGDRSDGLESRRPFSRRDQRFESRFLQRVCAWRLARRHDNAPPPRMGSSLTGVVLIFIEVKQCELLQ